MGKRQDIADDDQELEDDDLEENDESEEEDDDEEEQKPAPKQRQASPELREIQKSLAELRATAAAGNGGNKEEKAKISKVDALFTTLISNGYKEADLAPLAAIVQALKADMEESVDEKSKTDKKMTLDQRCFKAINDKIAVHAQEYPAVGWAQVEINSRVRNLLASGEQFQGARDAYATGHEPSDTDFRKATSLIVKTFLKESGIKKSDSGSSEQLDVKSSSKKMSNALSKDGKVDKSQLSDFELEIYQTTLNITKNEDLAKDALKAVRGKKF